MKRLFFLTFVFCTSAQAYFSLNSLNIDVDEYSPPLAINGKLMYLDGNQHIWISSSGYLHSSQAMINGQAVIAKTPVKSGNYILFINQSDGDTLWKTDGANFSRLTDYALDRLSKTRSNVVSSVVSGREDFITSDGETVYRYNTDTEAQTSNLELSQYTLSVCQFDENNLIFNATNINDGNQSHLYHYRNGEISNLQFIHQEEEITPYFEIYSNGSCVFQHPDYNSHLNDGSPIPVYYIIQNDGTVYSIESQDPNYFYDDFFSFHGNLYFFRKSSDYGTRKKIIYTFDKGEIVETADLSDLVLNVTDFWVSDNYLYSYNSYDCPVNAKCTPALTFLVGITVLDKDFSQVNFIDNEILKSREFEILYSQTKDMIHYIDGVQEITLLDNGVPVATTGNSNLEIIDIIGDADSGYYFIGKDINANRNLVILTSDIPVISSQISGLWTSQEWSSQGLSIHSGRRQDNSEYLFLSFYVYHNGEPFWIAGNADIDTGHPSQVINLYSYNGPSFLAESEDSEHQQTYFGTIKLFPTTCNSMNVEIQPVNKDAITLQMNRFTDITNSNHCVDE